KDQKIARQARSYAGVKSGISYDVSLSICGSLIGGRLDQTKVQPLNDDVYAMLIINIQDS
ncbi:hypothetical protein ACTXNJ_28470, partial [Pseudomonas helleri]|uniref:hypothetical protein n=1 Tax=Pseudomonas helleri TaxID=1608996 RepID=UPI003FD2A98D